MAVMEMLLGRLLAWLPAPWPSIRVQEPTARLCTYMHGPLISYGGADSMPRGELHIDLDVKLWSKNHVTTVRELEAVAADQSLVPYFPQTRLEPGGPVVEMNAELRPPNGEELQAQAGGHLRVKVLLTRGFLRTLRLPIQPETS